MRTSVFVIAGIIAIAGVFAWARMPGREAAGAAAADLLEDKVFPAMNQIQGGGYIDLDCDCVGEYGFLPELAGAAVRDGRVGPNQLKLLPEAFRAEAAVVDGYRFAAWLPDGSGGWMRRAADDPLAATGAGEPDEAEHARRQATAGQLADFNQRERSWLVFAWPAEGSGGEMYAIGLDGIVRRQAYAGVPPTPPDLIGGEGKPRWPPRK